MNPKSKRILAIETSCDETAAAVIELNLKTMRITPLSNVVYSQIDLHKKYGGVYPELASRAHIKKIEPVVTKALTLAQVESIKYKVESMNSDLLPSTFNLLPTAVDAIAVTVGPGLAGSLIVGVEFARGLAARYNLPVIPVNHLEGHIYASSAGVNSKHEARSTKEKFNNLNINKFDILSNFDIRISDFPQFPALALVVSGGHTLLVLMRDHLRYEIIGTTVDDAAGECFDKVARMLGLPYPGGPALSKLAEKGDAKAFNFPRAMMTNQRLYDFSFSGLKTAVFYKLRELGLVNDRAEPVVTPRRWPDGLLRGVKRLEKIRANIAASTQAAIVDVLVAKTLRAAADYKVKSILVGGGVSANSALRDAFQNPHALPLSKGETKRGWDSGARMYLSPTQLATDNALSIAIAAAYHLKNGDTTHWRDLESDSSLALTQR